MKGMTMDWMLAAVILLAGLAIFDLVVGVSNDAVNFLNSSIGSRVAPRHIIFLIASVGILVGTTFSSGMMEVARKGIFHPEFFTMPELLTLFLAVMLTDVILLDTFNTYGLPTSTTVSIVFELLGAAVAVSLIKVLFKEEGGSIAEYINTAKAITIIMGILLSVGVAFLCGAAAQFLTRILFTFEFSKNLKRFGALWGGMALAFIVFFILIKGAKGSSIISADQVAWIKANTGQMLLSIFVVSAIFLQVLTFLKVNILKPIILIGTFALAMAFAANDLVNFIGVPLAGFFAFKTASASVDPMTVKMAAMSQKVQSQTLFLLLAGAIMVITLWLSKKARSVSETELTLVQQDEGVERYESALISRLIVRMWMNIGGAVKALFPSVFRNWVASRMAYGQKLETGDGEQSSFDLLRAAVNLMVSSVVISYATSQKLPLSTTYVTFMVSMGTSFADGAWGRDSAVYRITGVLTVIGGWFFTAFSAFSVASIFACVIYFGGAFGVACLLLLATALIIHGRRTHSQRRKGKEEEEILNLKKVTDVQGTVESTYEHVAILLGEIKGSLERSVLALAKEDHWALRRERRMVKKIQMWVNIITANIFKGLRLLARGEEKISFSYASIVRRLQKLADGHRDVVNRSYLHIRNNHSGLLEEQVTDLNQVQDALSEILEKMERVFSRQAEVDIEHLRKRDIELRELTDKLNRRQMKRVVDGSSKTRLSIIYYAYLGNARMLSKQCMCLVELFQEALVKAKESEED
jgi:hypothetical protein